MGDKRTRELTAAVRAGLRARADDARAPGQQAYMKSEMPFLGVPVPQARRIARTAASTTTEAAILRAAARKLWDAAEYREERYAAMALLGLAPASADPDAVGLIVHMVRTGQWWDYTDELAHRMADLHDRFPAEAAAIVRVWSADDDLWVRRIAILSQLGRRDRVDAALLAELIEPSIADPEFFLRKAIGWALREYARVDPDWVLAYADSHPLSPLSRREALKHL
ncbi:DNA alkylation repair protein [Microbacterium pygmaeum]|uniref:3-methyladenine DNA glycosylase AlkD n=1 Tax=Microbacterium pygmaeum TaxID=370764 RepID=A0A1G8B1A6_9MICO|nr:DNA alkylation repair protein [Microbacterium pygmaeum]SDH26977.1 3-methyladenine DNA glycosylase AlkD [Microbacterium pygmaeum]